MEPLTVLLPFLGIIVLGTITQSISGMGFGLVSVPVFVALFGPIEGVLWGNVVGMVTALALVAQKREHIDWPIAIRFTIAAAPAIVLTVWGMGLFDTATLNLYVGLLMLAMVFFAVAAPKLPEASGRPLDYFTGFVGGFFSASVAQSGPAMTAYAQATRWDQNRFAATLQPYYLGMNIINIPLKIFFNVDPLSSSLNIPMFLLGIVAIVVGTTLAKYLIQLISARVARNFALVIALIGACVVISRGVSAFW
ncbi:MAG: sulfite exporter TauE/SafE family protein [Actinomycetaceae bacterium]|nr:sulfite exporter TauE/SafE family protein [Actinomycetaceae bacterium]